MSKLPIEIDIDRASRTVRFYASKFVPEGAMREVKYRISFRELFKIIERDGLIKVLYQVVD